MSTIAILGSGRVGTTLARKLATAHDVSIGSRDPDKTSTNWEGPSVKITDVAEAAQGASIVVNATPGVSSVERLGALSTELEGKILVDVSNAVERGEAGEPGGLFYPNSSLAEHLQRALPHTRVVKTLNTMLFTVMVDRASLTTPATVFLSGDDEDAKGVVRDLLGGLGWTTEHILDLGGIRTARGPEALMLLVPDILGARGFAPFAVTVVA